VRRIFVVDATGSTRTVAAALAATPDWHTTDTRPQIDGAPAIVVAPVTLVRAADIHGYAAVEWLPYGPAEAMLTAFLLGAADYLRTPLSLPEVQARVARLARGLSGRADLGSVVTIEGEAVVLPGSLHEIWALLDRHRGRIVDRPAIAACCGMTDGAESRAVDMAVSRLRRRVEPLGATIETIRGRGYRLRR